LLFFVCNVGAVEYIKEHYPELTVFLDSQKFKDSLGQHQLEVVDQGEKIGARANVIVHADGVVVKRKGAVGAGQWAPPGGKMDFGETPLECAARELKEETGMELLQAEQTIVTNDIFKENDTHYITLFFEGMAKGEPQLCEPDKCEKWQWFNFDQLPQDLFLSFALFLEQAQI
jgi:8-oxo-dGTP diphosphatase